MSDGDIILVTDSLGTKVKVRLYGIDAPETEKRNRRTGMVMKAGPPYGEEALQALTAKVKGKQVQVEVRDVDRYKRAVSVVRIGSRDINEEMVREGWAWRTGAIWSGRMRLSISGRKRRQGGEGAGFGGKGIRCRRGSSGRGRGNSWGKS